MQNYLLLFILLFFTSFIYAQQPDRTEAGEKQSIFQAAVIAGFNATQIEGDALGGYHKFGLNAGGALFIHLPKNFSINMEILYSQKGSKSTARRPYPNPVTGRLEDRKIALDYIDVPIIANFHDKRFAIFGIGFVLNTLVRYKETENTRPSDEPYKTFGLEIAGNVTFVIKEMIGLNLRWTYSLINIAKGPMQESALKNKAQRHNVLTVRAMYFFSRKGYKK